MGAAASGVLLFFQRRFSGKKAFRQHKRGRPSKGPTFQSLPDVYGPPARAELELEDFALCTEVCRLLAQIDALQNGTIEKIVVHGGVPRRVTIRQPLSQAQR